MQWASLVQTLTNRYPKAATMVLIDLLNEPDSQYLAWDWGWNTPGATELYLKGMDAIAAVNPCALPCCVCSAVRWCLRSAVPSSGLARAEPFKWGAIQHLRSFHHAGAGGLAEGGRMLCLLAATMHCAHGQLQLQVCSCHADALARSDHIMHWHCADFCTPSFLSQQRAMQPAMLLSLSI